MPKSTYIQGIRTVLYLRRTRSEGKKKVTDACPSYDRVHLSHVMIYINARCERHQSEGSACKRRTKKSSQSELGRDLPTHFRTVSLKVYAPETQGSESVGQALVERPPQKINIFLLGTTKRRNDAATDLTRLAVNRRSRPRQRPAEVKRYDGIKPPAIRQPNLLARVKKKWKSVT